MTDTATTNTTSQWEMVSHTANIPQWGTVSLEVDLHKLVSLIGGTTPQITARQVGDEIVSDVQDHVSEHLEGSSMFIDTLTESILEQIDTESIVQSLSYEISERDIASYLDSSEIAEHVYVSSRDIAAELDLGEIARFVGDDLFAALRRDVDRLTRQVTELGRALTGILGSIECSNRNVMQQAAESRQAVNAVVDVEPF